MNVSVSSATGVHTFKDATATSNGTTVTVTDGSGKTHTIKDASGVHFFFSE